MIKIDGNFLVLPV